MIRWRRALTAKATALLFAIAAGAGCFHPNPEDGQLLCASDGSCPSGFYCAGDFTCWHNGAAPTLDLTATARDLEAPADLAAPDLAASRDLSVPPDFIIAIDLATGADLSTTPDLALLPDLTMPDLTGPAFLGVPCARGSDCQSGFCVDGVCCFQAICPGQCTSCAAGHGLACGQAQIGQRDPRGLCTDDPTHCRSATCDGNGNCQPARAGTECAAAQCSNGLLAVARSCDGNSFTCPAATVIPCPGHFACANASSCSAACFDSSACVPGACCRMGGCADASLATSCGAQCLDCTQSGSGHACVGGACGCVVDGDCAGVVGMPHCDGNTKRCGP